MNFPILGEPSGGPSFVEGTAVFDVAGENIGTVSMQDPQVGYLVIQKGWLAHEIYVPFSSVVSQDGSGLFLNLSKHDLKDARWKVPPPDSDRASAANLPSAGGLQMGVVDTAPQDDEPFMSAPPLESLLREDG